MYLAIINWEASSSEESENNPGSMLASVVDELFKSRIMFDSISRSLERNLSGMPAGMLQGYTLSALMSILMADSLSAALTISFSA